MKNRLTATIFACNFLAACFSFADTATESALEEYRGAESNICAKISACFNSTGITNVYPVYAAGYIHSREAIPLIVSLIDVKAVAEPAKYYHPSFKWEDDGTGVETNKPFVVGRPSSLFPRPPTPAVAALTQMPISFETLTNLIVSANTDLKRQHFAWVAAAKYPNQYFLWIGALKDNAPDQWTNLYEYSTARLIGRKPFAVHIYKPSMILSVGLDVWKYDKTADRLRSMASEAMLAGDDGMVAAVSSCLQEMGLTILKPTLSEVLESVELVHE